jgi:hypothetical protein
MARINVRNPIAVCSSIGTLLACAILATIFLEQVQADASLGECDGVHVNAGSSGVGPRCQGSIDCMPVGECMPYPYLVPGGLCGPMGQQCPVAKFTDTLKYGQCSTENYIGSSCTTCDTYWCAQGQAFRSIDDQGVCHDPVGAPFVRGRGSYACVPSS